MAARRGVTGAGCDAGVSKEASDFNFDFGAAHTDDELRPFRESSNLGPMPRVAAQRGTDPAGYLAEAPIFSAFPLSDGVVYHTHSAGVRGLEFLMASTASSTVHHLGATISSHKYTVQTLG